MGSALAAVLMLLSDRHWHSIHELIGVGGVRAGSRIHELRRGEDGGPLRRILCRMVGASSEYRLVCACGPIAKDLEREPTWCPACREAVREMASDLDAQRSRAHEGACDSAAALRGEA